MNTTHLLLMRTIGSMFYHIPILQMRTLSCGRFPYLPVIIQLCVWSGGSCPGVLRSTLCPHERQMGQQGKVMTSKKESMSAPRCSEGKGFCEQGILGRRLQEGTSKGQMPSRTLP